MQELQQSGFAFSFSPGVNTVEAVGENEDGATGEMLVRYTVGPQQHVEILQNGLQLKENIRTIWRTCGNTHWGTVTDAAMLSKALRVGFIIFSNESQGQNQWIYGAAMEDATFAYWGLIYCINNAHFKIAEALTDDVTRRSMYFSREHIPAAILAHYNRCNSSCPIGTSTVGRVT